MVWMEVLTTVQQRITDMGSYSREGYRHEIPALHQDTIQEVNYAGWDALG
jgi:hypothetical protein